MKQVTYSKLTDHRGNKRIWLEGKRLAACGFTVGSFYNLNIVDGYIALSSCETGERKVSGRKRKGQTVATPIIDICSAEVTKQLGKATRVRAVFSQGLIVITIHHEDTDKADRESRFNDSMKNKEVTEGTLCAGAGIATAALHEGFKTAGINTVCEWIVDREGKYLQVAIDNNQAIGDAVIFEASLEELEPELLTPVDILQVSLPCTGHSKAGKVKNKITSAEQHSTDATAVLGLFPAIKAANPAVIISENVREAQDSATYTLIKAGLVRLGYRIEEMVLNEAIGGSLERRSRYWLIAISDGLKVAVDGLIKPLARIHSTLNDVLEPNAGGWSENQYLKDKAIKDKKAGKGFATRQLLTGSESSCGTIGRHYNKRRSTEPFIVDGSGLERLLTPIEHARVKRVPESLVLNVPATTAHEVLGQSILWGHMRQIAVALAH